MIKINEIFGPTIQGEGTHAGVVSCFVRTSGCNMWSGVEKDKATSACPYCDTDFKDGDLMSVTDIVHAVLATMRDTKRFVVVLTGGEPLLQNHRQLNDLTVELRRLGIPVHLETNGTKDSTILDVFDRVCVSPKLPYNKCLINWKHVDEVKVLYPHPNEAIQPEDFGTVLLDNRKMKFSLQPISKNIAPVLEKLSTLNWWKLSVQLHKYIGVE